MSSTAELLVKSEGQLRAGLSQLSLGLGGFPRFLPLAMASGERFPFGHVKFEVVPSDGLSPSFGDGQKTRRYKQAMAPGNRK